MYFTNFMEFQTWNAGANGFYFSSTPDRDNSINIWVPSRLGQTGPVTIIFMILYKKSYIKYCYNVFMSFVNMIKW